LHSGGELEGVALVNLAPLGCALRTTTKKVVYFVRKKVHP